MAAFDLNALSENASRLGMRLQETLSEHTRDLTRGSNPTTLDTLDEKQIRKQLDSNSDREKLDAMKRLIGLLSRGRNVSEFFAQVVKNVAAPNLEVRKLVYIYLLRYAEAEPDLALLSINTFQKDLADPSPLIRAMALRVLAGIRVPMIASLIVLAIRKAAADPSPYVRKAAALAVPKCFHLDPTRQGELVEVVAGLLRDRAPLTLGAVLAAHAAICPTRLDLLHPHFRRLCRTLIDADEWGQLDAFAVLSRYARTMFPRPQPDAPFSDADPDLRLLLASAEPLLMSDNAAVSLAVARMFYFLAPPSEWPKIVQPLLRLLHVGVAVERSVLAHLLAVAPSLTEELTPLWPRLLIRADDIGEVKRDKARLLRRLLSPDNYQALLREFIVYADDTDDILVAEAVQAIGHCARLFPESTTQCVASLMAFIRSKNDVVVTNAVLVLQSLIRTRLPATPAHALPGGPAEILARLAHRIADIHHPAARACVFWLAGQYAADPSPEPARVALPEELRGVRPWAPDLLRVAARGFAAEASVTKLQILTLAAKLLALAPGHAAVSRLARYTFSQARFDASVDVRDRARMLGALLAGVSGAARGEDDAASGGVVLRQAQVRMVLFEGKAGVGGGTADEDVDTTAFGTLAALTGKQTLHSDTYLPDWLERGVDPALRDSPDDAPAVRAQAIASPAIRSIGSAPGTPVAFGSPVGFASPSGSFTPQGAKGVWSDLDKFYEDAAEDDNDDNETSEEEEEESEDESEASEEATEADGGSEDGDGNEEDRDT